MLTLILVNNCTKAFPETHTEPIQTSEMQKDAEALLSPLTFENSTNSDALILWVNVENSLIDCRGVVG